MLHVLLTTYFYEAILEFKIILSALVKQFSFAETDASIESRVAITLQPFVAGRLGAGRQLPLRVQLLDAS